MKVSKEKAEFQEKVVLMHVMEGKSARIVAEELNISVKRVCSIISHCTKEVMRKLKKEEVSISLTGKQEPYYTNEMDYGSNLPQFKWCDLSKQEQVLLSKN